MSESPLAGRSEVERRRAVVMLAGSHATRAPEDRHASERWPATEDAARWLSPMSALTGGDGERLTRRVNPCRCRGRRRAAPPAASGVQVSRLLQACAHPVPDRGPALAVLFGYIVAVP